MIDMKLIRAELALDGIRNLYKGSGGGGCIFYADNDLTPCPNNMQSVYIYQEKHQYLFVCGEHELHLASNSFWKKYA